MKTILLALLLSGCGPKDFTEEEAPDAGVRVDAGYSCKACAAEVGCQVIHFSDGTMCFCQYEQKQACVGNIY